MLLITDLPDLMEQKEHWPVAAACLRRWFRAGPHAMPDSVKVGRVPPTQLGPVELEENLLTMAWALRFPRVKRAYDTLTGTVWRNQAALTQMGVVIRRRLQADASVSTTDKPWRFGDLSKPAKVVDVTCQVNILSVGDVSDPLDDFYGAVGKGTLKVAISGMVTVGKARALTVAVDTLGVYLRDTYDFNGNQPLGLWSERGLDHGRIAEAWFYETHQATPIAIEPPEKPGKPDPEANFGVSNADFRRYRAKFDRGYDYINLSDVLVVKLPQIQTFVLP